MPRTRRPIPHLYDYYEAAVQDAPSECEFFARFARRELGREAYRLREDFCGTFWLGHEWARQSPRHRALGVDLDPAPIAWGKQRHGGDPALAARLTTRLQDVRRPVPGTFDLTVALNFSYFIFHARADLLAYFRAVRRSLAKPGLFVLDHFGGPEIFEPNRTRSLRRLPDGRRFHYTWEEKDFNSITHQVKCAIHFEPRDAPARRNAFVYDWRLWSLPELLDLLAEAGFPKTDVYLESDDGVFRKRVRGERDCLQWIAYIVARN